VSRIHAFELNDQPWLPEVLRRGETEYLERALDLARPFTPLVPKLAALLEQHGDRVIDLAAGSGGPWRSLRDEVAAARGGRAPEVIATDLYPRAGVRAVDARSVPADLSGVRTMFDAFHHLRPDDARAVLADAHARRAPILIAEATSRRAPVVIASFLLIPLLVLALTPTVRPWSGWRLLLTYVLPVLPLIIWWDGVVSCLRTYRPEELRKLTAGLDGFTWETAEIRTRGGVISYLLGAPS
jgi:hypothetical protein